MSVVRTFTSQELHRLAPGPRRALLLAVFDALAEGEAFVIVGDHDLSPIRAALGRERSGAGLRWEDEVTGPPTWRVRVSRAA